MKKIIYLTSLLLLTSVNLAYAAADDKLSQKCINIINYKMVNDTDAMLNYYHPKVKENSQGILYFKKDSKEALIISKRKGKFSQLKS